MSATIPSIKKNAKDALKDNWVIAIVSALTILFSFFIIVIALWVLSIVIGNDIAELLLLSLNVLFLGPLILGVIRHFWRMFGGLSEAPSTVFYFFSSASRYIKSLHLAFKFTIKYLIAYIIFNIPSFTVSVISDVRLYDFLKTPIPMWSQNLTVLGDFLSVLATVLTIISLIRFYLAPILVIANDEIDVDEAFHMSSVISKKSVSDFVYLLFGVLHWLIISLLFIPLVFTLPYFIMCYISHSLEAIDSYNEKIKKLNEENFPSYVAGA